MSKDNIKIPDKHYVGMVKHGNNTLPLGFMTPWGSDAAGIKRMSTVDHWVSGHSRWASSKSPESITIDNLPLSGFKLTSKFRTGGAGSCDHWRVEDPRGFELEISSDNLAELLSIGMVDRGEIIDECVWARIGGNNVLLSTATQKYKDAVENTVVANSSASWKDVKLGNTIVLQNNTRGIWLGRMHMIDRVTVHRAADKIGPSEIVISEKTVHVIYVQDNKGLRNLNRYSQALHLIANPKLSKIVDNSSTLTNAAAELLANQLLVDNACYLMRTTHSSLLMLTFGKPKATTDYSLERIPKQISNSKELDVHSRTKIDDASVFVEKEDGTMGMIRPGRDDNYMVYYHSLTELSQQLDPSTWKNIRGFVEKSELYTWSPTDKIFNLSLNVSTKSGNALERLLY